MRQLIGLLCLLGLAFFLLSEKWQQPRPNSDAAALHCHAPISWRLASLDPQFKLDESQALSAIRQAAEAWNQQLGALVLVEDPTHGFPIDFIYDERQQQLLSGQRVARNIANYDAYLAGLSAELTALRADYEQRYADFSTRKQQLQQQIASGSLSAQTIQLEQQVLQQQADEVNAYAGKLNDKQRHYQASIDDRNALIPAEQQRARIAEVGLLIRNNQHLAMKIFAYHDQDTLVLTLTHEFGHALGIGHLPEASAVMHEALSAEQQGLTSADIIAAKQQCNAAG